MIVRAGLLGLVLLTAVLLETVVASVLLVAGHAPAIVVLTVVGVALADGSETGARYGFAAGLLTDLLGGGLLGMHTIVLVIVGWSVGATRAYLAGPPVVIRLVIGGAASAAAVAAYGLLTFVLDPDAVTATGLAQATVVTGLYSGVLAPLVAGAAANASRRAAALGGSASH
jgi:rod shape-determining protein MreD